MIFLCSSPYTTWKSTDSKGESHHRVDLEITEIMIIVTNALINRTQTNDHQVNNNSNRQFRDRHRFRAQLNDFKPASVITEAEKGAKSKQT